MKRSTIILIIYFILNAIVPVIVLKSCVGSSPKEQVDMWQTTIHNKSDATVRYLLIPKGENDSTELNINIRSEEKRGNPGRTLVNGREYEKDSLLIAANSQGVIDIAYEGDFSLIIENRNPRAAIRLDKTVADELMISSCGEVNLYSANVGVVLLTDSLGVAPVLVKYSNIGTLVSSRERVQSLFIMDSNVGRISIPVGSSGYEVQNSSVGTMLNGGKREVLIGGSNVNVKIAVEVDSLENK